MAPPAGAAACCRRWDCRGWKGVTADKLIEGVRIAVTGTDTLSVSYLTVVPFFSVTETASLRPGAPATRGKRRDGKAGLSNRHCCC